jgi:hypothetical protein
MHQPGAPRHDRRVLRRRKLQSSVGSLRVALDLHAAGVAIMRQNLRRRFPEASEDDIDRRLREWIRTCPGAELGDAPGRPRPVAE